MQGQVTDDGVRLSSGRQLSWDQVYYVDWTAKEARLATAAGVVSVSRADGDRAERRLAPWEAERDAWVREAGEQRRLEWAGVTSGKSATARQGCATPAVVLLLWVLVGVLLFSAIMIGDAAGALVMGTFAVALGTIPLLMGRALLGPTVTRDADGLRLGGLRARRIRWADLRHSDEVRQPTNDDWSATRLVIQTRQGRIELPPDYKDGEALRAGLRQALADRAKAVPTGRRRGLFAPSRRRPGQGLWLDRDGLAQVRAKRVTRNGWSRLGEPVWGATGARLSVAGRPMKLTAYLRADRLAHAIDKRRAGDEPLVDATGQLRAEAIERWLGVKPGGALRCRLSPWMLWGCGAATLAVAAFLIWCIATDQRVRNVGQVLGMMIAIFLSMLGSARAVEADARGLSVRRGRKREYHAWSDIASLGETRHDWVIATTAGEVALSRVARGADRVIGIVKRILAMRDRGAALPSQAPMPEVALSLARDRGERDAARGLSVSADD